MINLIAYLYTGLSIRTSTLSDPLSMIEPLSEPCSLVSSSPFVYKKRKAGRALEDLRTRNLFLLSRKVTRSNKSTQSFLNRFSVTFPPLYPIPYN